MLRIGVDNTTGIGAVGASRQGADLVLIADFWFYGAIVAFYRGFDQYRLLRITLYT